MLFSMFQRIGIQLKLIKFAFPLKMHLTTQKLSYGQGGTCQLNLTKQDYLISFQTIWEDHCLLQINGEEKQSLFIQEEGSRATVSDLQLQPMINNKVNILFKIPENYTFYGLVNGSITHTKSVVSNRLRSNKTKIQLLGKNRLMQWRTFETPSISIFNKEGSIDIQTLSCQDGHLSSNSFSASKITFSDQLEVKATDRVNIRSVVAFGNGFSKIFSKYVQIQSISGLFDIQAQSVNIKRVWANPGGIKIKTKKVEKISIETGSGLIQSIEPINQNSVVLGRMQKSKINKINDYKIIIQ